jgi:hypothetical protein
VAFGEATMTQIIKRLLVGILIVVVLSVGFVWYRTATLGKAFTQVQRGDSPVRVIQLFGERPYVTTDIETNIIWNEVWVDKNNGIKCVRQFYFYPPFTICGESWVVGFDEYSNAVAKYHIVSP